MATAKAGPRQTTRRVTLKLTEGEADFVLGLTAMVSGSLTRSPRKYGERILVALTDALGYDYTETDAIAFGLGDIEFREYDEEPVTDWDRIHYFLRKADQDALEQEILDQDTDDFFPAADRLDWSSNGAANS